MKYGFSEKQLQEIQNILASYEVEEAILFGSRAIDTYKEASDVDIAIKGEKADWSLAITLKEHLEEETYLPFFFDIVAYNSIKSDELRQHIDGKGKVLYSRRGSAWSVEQLGNVLEIKYGKDHKNLQKGNNPCIGSGGIMRYVNEFLYDKESILIPRKGSLNNIMYQSSPFWTVDTMFWTKINATIIFPKFLFYQLALIDYTNLNVGSAVPSLTVPIIKEIEINLPPLPEQKAIAEVLSSLDDKIDLLHRQNKTLEQMAETLFRQWFVEEAQEDWEERPLSFFGDIICGKTPSKKKKEYYSGDVPFIKIPDMHGKIFVFSTNDSLTEAGKNTQIKSTLPSKSICISCIATVGLVILTTKESHTNQQINSIVPYKNEYRYYLFLLMKSSYDLLHAMASGGTATLNLNTGNFSKIEIPLPDEKKLKDFHNKIESIFDKVYFNQAQIHTLEKMRDTLLPKLMSGEVRVSIDE